MSGLRIGVLGASRIAEVAIVSPAAALGHRLVAVAARDRNRAETFAARDYMLQYGDDRIEITTDTGTTVEHLGTRSTYTYQLQAFADHLQHGTPLPLDVDDAVTNMHYIDTAYTAAGMSPR